MKDVQRKQKTASVYGRGRVKVKRPIAPALYFGPTRGKESGMWWRFWSVHCGPYRNGKYRVITARCPIHLPVGVRFMQKSSIHASALRAMKRAAFVTAARQQDVGRWKSAHRGEWRRLDKSKMTKSAVEWAASCRK